MRSEVEQKLLELGRALIRASSRNGLKLGGQGFAGKIELMGQAMEIAAMKQIPEKYAAEAISLAMENQ